MGKVRVLCLVTCWTRLEFCRTRRLICSVSARVPSESLQLISPKHEERKTHPRLRPRTTSNQRSRSGYEIKTAVNNEYVFVAGLHDWRLHILGWRESESENSWPTWLVAESHLWRSTRQLDVTSFRAASTHSKVDCTSCTEVYNVLSRMQHKHVGTAGVCEQVFGRLQSEQPLSDERAPPLRVLFTPQGTRPRYDWVEQACASWGKTKGRNASAPTKLENRSLCECCLISSHSAAELCNIAMFFCFVSLFQCWSFSSAFNPTRAWHFNDFEHLSKHLKICPYYIIEPKTKPVAVSLKLIWSKSTFL